ncbi:MAG: hypothetical protein AAF587_39185 [Bacteroidota bacterium]
MGTVNYSPDLLLLLLSKAFGRANLQVNYQNFEFLCEKIMYAQPGPPLIGRDYLYRSLFLRINKAIEDGDTYMPIRKVEIIDKLAQYVGYRTFQEFKIVSGQQISRALQSCIGNWYYYVRESTGRDVMLRSPVRISEGSMEVKMELVGKHRWFEGVLQERHGGIFCQLEDERQEKMLHLVLKVGIRQEAEVLRGVCAGFSSEGIPVAGKVYLIRQGDQTFDELTIDRLTGNHSPPYPPGWPVGIVEELRSFEENYLMVLPGKGFDLDGVGRGKEE